MSFSTRPRIVRIALLVCGHFTRGLLAENGDYLSVYKRWLEASLPICVDDRLEVHGYEVQDIKYPPERDIPCYDAIMLTGSQADGSSNEPWILILVKWVQRVAIKYPFVKLYGFSFGHQIISRSLGGICEPNGNGPEIGPTTIQATDIGRSLFGITLLDFQQFHRNHVPLSSLSNFFVTGDIYLLASSEKTANQGFVRFYPLDSTEGSNHRKEEKDFKLAERVHILAIQGHPEFTEPITSAFARKRKEEGTIDQVAFEDYFGRHGHLSNVKPLGESGTGRRWKSDTDGVEVVGRVVWESLGVKCNHPVHVVQAQNCRNVPGSPNYPSDSQWQLLNNTVSGRLVHAIPSGQYCRQTNCTDAEWTSANWRNTVPGAMNEVNWEQDHDSNPPSLCGRTSPATCGQGDVPLYAILAESAEDIQAGVNFAREYNLRLAVKASGHDLLGRSTAKNSFLIHTHKLQSVAFTDNFQVGNQDLGSAVTVGSGVGLSALYNASKAEGKIFVGGSAATVVAGGGYVQGAGHSALSPMFGLAADNVLEFNVVTADGVLRRVNENSNSDLFWAMRGGGAGSWGAIVNATFRTYPTFNATQSLVLFTATNSSGVGAITEAHAKHIFDLKSMHAGQYYSVTYIGPNTTYAISISTVFPRATSEQVVAAMEPMLRDILNAGGILTLNTTNTATINELLAQNDDQVGDYLVIGSRLIPEASYQQSPKDIGDAYKGLIDAGTYVITTPVLGGGQVAENVKIDSAVIPGWRTAKSHIIVGNPIPENGTIEEVHAAQNLFKTTQLPLFATIQGQNASAYSNEADRWEENWQTVFYGPNYSRLSAIKTKYDPTDLFIVATGVGSERWDSYGLCRV
ncbi:Putative glutamine amidotransferase-like protein C13C5.04 [Leucoagaricus sp. SymC.cos]|nr:Putative glutamine amidotransferase-like protein C13C5.04 [Leucoagaricus sp. SymC.cos]